MNGTSTTSIIELYKMWICLMLLGAVLAVSASDYGTIVKDGEFSRMEEFSLKNIVPSGYSSHGVNGNKAFQLSYLLPKDNEFYTNFNKYVEKGVTMKGLTFNVYDDDMRNAAVSLFRLMRDTRKKDKTNFDNLKKWAKYNVNSDILDYAWRLASLYDDSYYYERFLPPFLIKPNYFIGGETILKAFYVSENIGKISDSVLDVYQVLNLDERSIAINTNYTGWNMPLDSCDKQIRYFTEDISLNSFYYGVHLLHPFWMSDEELNNFSLLHADHYYYAHQQLYARYLLEKEHLGPDAITLESDCEPEYNPYLYYENGLPFPTRSAILEDDMQDYYNHIKAKDIAIKESIHRGIVEMENGTRVKLTEDNYMNIIAKLVRSQMDSVKTAKVTRSIFGHGASDYPIDKYNPAPSILYHPQTSLREPVYWYMIKRDLEYFLLYTNNTDPYDLSKHETNDFTISNIGISKVSTSFEYYLINLYKSLEGDKTSHVTMSMPYVFARQRRLNHQPFELNFTVESKMSKNVSIRIFLGPPCSISNCWDSHFKFFQLDYFRITLPEGLGKINWSPDKSSNFYSDKSFNRSVTYDSNEENYNVFKFPKHLAIPKGKADGLNLTLFIMVDEDQVSDSSSDDSQYRLLIGNNGNKPFGFPFHRQADKETLNDNAHNYRFLNFSVFHIETFPDGTGYFSPNLF